jgi:phage FluMu gp28-like protein
VPRVANVFKRLLRIVGEDQISEYGSEQYDKWLNQAFQFTAREIRFPNGGRVVSLPGRDPDTLAGLTGNIIFTEFGLFPGGGYDHWRVVFPLTTRGFSCIVISTPRGKNTKFYELFINLDGLYSVHFCDIYKSVAEDGFVLRDNDGNPTTIEQFKKLYGDNAGFDREYGCQFTGDLSALITWAELERAAGLDNPDGFTFRMIRDAQTPARSAAPFVGALAGVRLEVGWDVARRGDLSVIAVNKSVRPDVPKRLVAVIAMHNCTFEFMRAMVVSVMDTSRFSVGYGDATGLGMESNEALQTKYRERWTPHTFTGVGKREVASALKTAFSDGNQTIPPLDSEHKLVATDLYAIQKDDTGANARPGRNGQPAARREPLRRRLRDRAGAAGRRAQHEGALAEADDPPAGGMVSEAMSMTGDKEIVERTAEWLGCVLLPNSSYEVESGWLAAKGQKPAQRYRVSVTLRDSAGKDETVEATSDRAVRDAVSQVFHKFAPKHPWLLAKVIEAGPMFPQPVTRGADGND